MSERTTPSSKEISTQAAIQVEVVSEPVFEEIKATRNKLVNVAMNHFETSTGTEPILNEGAGPCAIIYLINKTTHAAISGHYPEVSHTRDQFFLKKALTGATAALTDDHSEITLPTAAEVKWLADPSRVIAGYGKFAEMEQVISQLVPEWGPENLEVHLFGQNPIVYGERVEKSQRLVTDAIGHNDLTIRIRELGISAFHIHDHRSLTEDKVDHTLYDPLASKIYQYKRFK